MPHSTQCLRICSMHESSNAQSQLSERLLFFFLSIKMLASPLCIPDLPVLCAGRCGCEIDPRRLLQKLNPYIKYMTAHMHCARAPYCRKIPENVLTSTSCTCGACAQCVPEGTRCEVQAVQAVQAGVRYFPTLALYSGKETPPELQCRQKGTGMRCIFPVPQRLLEGPLAARPSPPSEGVYSSWRRTRSHDIVGSEYQLQDLF